MSNRTHPPLLRLFLFTYLLLLLTLSVSAQSTPELTLPSPAVSEPSSLLSTPPSEATANEPDSQWIIAAALGVIAVLAIGVLRSNSQLAKALGESVPYQMVAPHLYKAAKSTSFVWDDAALEEVAKLTSTTFQQTSDGKGWFVSTPTANIDKDVK